MPAHQRPAVTGAQESGAGNGRRRAHHDAPEVADGVHILGLPRHRYQQGAMGQAMSESRGAGAFPFPDHDRLRRVAKPAHVPLSPVQMEKGGS